MSLHQCSVHSESFMQNFFARDFYTSVLIQSECINWSVSNCHTEIHMLLCCSFQWLVHISTTVVGTSHPRLSCSS